MGRLFFIYVISFILLSYIYQQGPKYIYKNKSYPDFASLQKLEQRIKQNIPHSADAALLQSYVRGGSKSLSPRQKHNHRILNLQHLWSPSGIHLAAALMWILPLLPAPTAPGKCRRKRFLRTLILLLLYALPWSLPGYFAIKRICLLRILYLLLTQIHLRPNYFYFYLGVMGIDFCWGTYQAAPLSFAYSFLFLGTIVAIQPASPLKQSLALLGGQMIASYFNFQAVTVWGHLLGQIITGIFTVCFPLFFISYWGQLFFDFPWAKWPIHYFSLLLNGSAAVAHCGGYFYPTWDILALMATLFLRRSILKYILLTILLLLHSDPCFNQPRYQMMQEAYFTMASFTSS